MESNTARPLNSNLSVSRRIILIENRMPHTIGNVAVIIGFLL